MQAFIEQIPNPSLSCEPKLTVSFTGLSRYRDETLELYQCRSAEFSEFRWYHGRILVRPKLFNLSLGHFLCSEYITEDIYET